MSDAWSQPVGFLLAPPVLTPCSSTAPHLSQLHLRDLEDPGSGLVILGKSLTLSKLQFFLYRMGMKMVPISQVLVKIK